MKELVLESMYPEYEEIAYNDFWSKIMKDKTIYILDDRAFTIVYCIN